MCKVAAQRVEHLRHLGLEYPMYLGDPTTFGRIYDEHRRGVHATAYRVLGSTAEAQDVVQDVFLRVWRNPGRFDAGRGELGSYLRLMARSRAVDLWREGQASGRASDRLKVVVATDAPRDDARPDRLALESADRSTVRDAVRRLPAAQREALVLAYWGGLTADQIAARAGVPLGTAKSRIRLGLARLRDELGGTLPDRAAVAA
ncbi:MAG TPA: sigma-70 family RNA polymerase sigma factor [Baekduia sp.]|uniref:sigma-70 family RNA polymerase sigma factor n=1 Tax=Baekduia sp. TaxID=2600305 RepID=UPI002C863CEC|nr:sigma-70 family RNA polymerase sigma factor [Baekduia sp.]HMJ36918.1 sigma-70 family RNA polymerase sigma factor [Baekduia sp.]